MSDSVKPVTSGLRSNRNRRGRNRSFHSSNWRGRITPNSTATTAPPYPPSHKPSHSSLSSHKPSIHSSLPSHHKLLTKFCSALYTLAIFPKLANADPKTLADELSKKKSAWETQDQDHKISAEVGDELKSRLKNYVTKLYENTEGDEPLLDADKTKLE
jgi:hypothetical protein